MHTNWTRQSGVRSKPSCLFKNCQLCLVSLPIRVNRDREDNTIWSVWKPAQHNWCRVLEFFGAQPLSISPSLLSIIKTIILALELLPAGVAHLSACVTCFRQLRKERWSYLLLGNFTRNQLEFLHTSEQMNAWWHHDWRGISRDTYHCSEWLPAVGRSGTALLLYLQAGRFAAPGWTGQLLSGLLHLGTASATGFWHGLIVDLGISIGERFFFCSRLACFFIKPVWASFWMCWQGDLCTLFKISVQMCGACIESDNRSGLYENHN